MDGVKRLFTFRNAVIGMLSVVLGYSIVQLVQIVTDYERNHRLYAELREAYAPVPDVMPLPVERPAAHLGNPTDNDQPAQTAAPEIEYAMDLRTERSITLLKEAARRKEAENKLAELRKLNRDTVGWIRIPGTNIDYPIVQGKDNAFYLKHDFNKKYNRGGSIFMDYRNAGSFSDRNTIIFGHNMHDQSMFHDLVRFKDKAFFNENRTFEVYTPEGVQEWEVFLVFVTDTNFDYLLTDFSSESEFQQFMKDVRKKADHTRSVSLKPKEPILTLSTCSYEYDQARTVVMAKRIS